MIAKEQCAGCSWLVRCGCVCSDAAVSDQKCGCVILSYLFSLSLHPVCIAWVVKAKLLTTYSSCRGLTNYILIGVAAKQGTGHLIKLSTLSLIHGLITVFPVLCG